MLVGKSKCVSNFPQLLRPPHSLHGSLLVVHVQLKKQGLQLGDAEVRKLSQEDEVDWSGWAEIMKPKSRREVAVSCAGGADALVLGCSVPMQTLALLPPSAACTLLAAETLKLPPASRKKINTGFNAD